MTPLKLALIPQPASIYGLPIKRDVENIETIGIDMRRVNVNNILRRVYERLQEHRIIGRLDNANNWVSLTGLQARMRIEEYMLDNDYRNDSWDTWVDSMLRGNYLYIE
eukprot:Pgem_evm1s1168